MFRILYVPRTIVLALTLLAAMAVAVHAQQIDEFPIELAVSGETPSWLDGTHGYFANDDSGNTWLVTSSEVWSFSPDSLKWARWPSVRMDDIEVRLGYDGAKKRFLFWNGGVGKVYTWIPGDTTTTRIDKSFHHRTQFGHAWFVHPQSGEIYAFGGYGFWQSRGYTARFDMKALEWLVVPLDGSKPYPSPRAGSKHTYDAKRGHFHIFGGHNYRNEGREDLSVDFVDFDDYWVLDIVSREWVKKPLYGLKGAFELNKEIRRNNEIYYFAVSDHANDLAWYPVRSTEGSYDIRMLVFDYSRGFGAYTPISLGELGNKSNIQWFSYDASKNQLLIYWMQATSAGNDRPIRVSSLQLPHPDSTRAMMDMIRMYGSVNPPDKASNYWLLLLAMLPVLGGGVWFWKRKRQLVADATRKLAEKETEFDEADAHHHSLKICYVGQPRLLIDDEEAKIQIGDAELHLLLWLHWKSRLGEPFQITDRIEEVFWTDSPNLDYVRKQRNTTLRRLNEHLSDALGHYEPSHAWVTDRASIIDKRKREYALDLNGLRVRCDLDEDSAENISPSDVLATCKGTWADQIRDEFAAGRPSNNFANMKAGA